MLNEFQVRREIEDTGLSAVCAWCERYWEAKARAEGHAFGCGVGGCGGPGVGGAFHLYKGPRPNKASYCYVCGAEADLAVEFHGAAGGLVGCCKAHEQTLRIMLSRTGKPVVVNERLVPVIQTKAEGDA